METNPKISCENCIGACCRAGTAISLTVDEANNLADAGTDMYLLPMKDWHGNKPGRNRKFYFLRSDCGNLVDEPESGKALCGDYENRPKICREFVVGGGECESMREALGVGLPDGADLLPIEPVEPGVPRR